MDFLFENINHLSGVQFAMADIFRRLKHTPGGTHSWFSLHRPLAVMTVTAGNKMDVVLAGGGKIGGIHLLDIQSAMRVSWMTGGTGRFGGIGMGRMAIQTA